MSDLLNKKIIKKIANRYDIDINIISLLRESPDNRVYLLKTKKDKFILRVSKRDIRKDVLFETTWLNYLLQQGVPVVEPIAIKTAKGRLLSIFDKGVCVLFKFAQGQHIRICPSNKPHLAKVKNAAVELARIHNASQKAHISLPRRRTIFTEIDRALNIKNKLVKLADEEREFIKKLVFYRSWAEKNYNDNCLLHNDYRPTNVLFKKDKVSTILDFDWACRGPAIKDVALSLVEWSFPDRAKEHWQEVFVTFLQSYNLETKNIINLDNDLYHWVCFSCLSDAATYFADLVEKNIYKKILSSYMYKKFLYFRAFIK